MSTVHFQDCLFYDDQKFIYHVLKDGKEIGITVAKSPNGAIRNIVNRLHKENRNISYRELKDGCEAVILYEDIKEIQRAGKRVKIIWNWRRAKRKNLIY